MLQPHRVIVLSVGILILVAGTLSSKLRAVAVTIGIVMSTACATSNTAQNATAPTGTVPDGWHVYTDAAYKFSVAYPDDLGIVPEKTPLEGGAVQRVRFQDRQLLGTPFADLEPARLTVEVFGAGSSSLTDWLRSVNRLPSGATTTAITLAGTREGIHVQSPQQLAPNDFYYFATDKYVYALTPLGQDSSTMLASFRLL